MIKRPRIYLDNAATSWPKPQAVYDVVDDYQRRLGAAVGRGGYAEAEEVGRAVDETRASVARLIGAEGPERIIFTFNGTDSLNLAMHGLLRAGDHVITTVAEHNSVLRPLRRLEKRKRNEVTRIGCDAAGVIDPDDIQSALRPETSLIILTHASNVTGALQPVAEVGRIAREHGVLLLVDAAQTLGHMPVSVAELGADLLAAPGHKGLLGPLGTGILYMRPGVEEIVDTIRQGGTGSSSSDDNQPDTLPEKYESGNHNAPGILGLGAGIEYLVGRGVDDIRRHAIDLTDLLLQGLSDVPGVEIFGPRDADERIGVVSFSLDDHDPPRLAKMLDEQYGIQARAGFQCAALMHRSLGTLESNGTVRFSVGPFNTEEDVATAVRAISEIARSDPATDDRIACPCVSTAHESPQMVMPAAAEAGPSPSEAMDPSAIPGLQALWAKTLGDPEICVAVVDGPVDLTHPAFKQSRLETLKTYASTACRRDGPACMHGTHVASIVFGQHEERVKGIAPRCRGIVLPIFRDTADDRLGPSSQVDVARAISAAIDAGANVINVSGGELSNSGAAHPLLADALKRCADKGILVVAAAGNDGCACLHIPGAMPSVLAVGAMDGSGQPLGFSNWAEGYQKNGILASGERILGAQPGARWSANTGTSFATPIVSGVVALLLCLQRAAGRPVNAGLVKQALLRSAVGCSQQQTKDDCQRLLAGRLNITGALTLLSLGDLEMKKDVTSQDRTRNNHQDESLGTDPLRGNSRGKLTPAACGCGTQPAQDEEALDDDADMEDELDDDDMGLNSLDEADEIEGEDEALDDDDLTPAAARLHGRAPRTRRGRRAGSRVQPASSKPRRTRRSADSSTRPSQRALPPRRAMSRPLPQGAFLPSDCGCGGGGPPQLVYALGKVGFDFGSEARRDSIQVNIPAEDGAPQIVENPEVLLAHLAQNPVVNESIIYTLNFDLTPIYAVKPFGTYAASAYDMLRDFIVDQIKGGVERVSIPGVIMGEITLLNGETVPVIVPDQRGMFSWSTQALAESVKDQAKQVKRDAGPDDVQEELENFLNRIYYEFRNLGTSAEERALNFAGTNVVLFAGDIASELGKGFTLDEIQVAKSAFCRPDSDCWDVELTFYNPNDQLGSARTQFIYTVDVSDVIPVAVGAPRSFRVR